MANLPESPAPATRDVSPITQPPSPIAIKIEDDEAATAPKAERSLSVLSEPEDSEPNLGGVSGRSASAPSFVDETVLDTTEDISTALDTTGDISMDADTTGDINTTTIQTRCVVNFLDPQPGKCDSKITDDDRHYISNFFGRNKSCSTSIPDEYYQVLCRKCMQAMKYRLKTGSGASEIQVQVAAIKHALRNMAASGRWVHVEVQLTKSEYDRRQDPEKYDADLKKFNDDVIKDREEAKAKGEKARRRNTKKAITPVPDWLAELVVDKENARFKVHDRKPTAWTFEDLIGLVDLIGENCDVLPSIEGLVVTQGELDKVELEIARTCRHFGLKELETLYNDIAENQEALKKDPSNKEIQSALKDVQRRKAEMVEVVKVAEQDIKKAIKICEGSKHTLPPKRLQLKKAATKGETSKTAAKKGKGKKAETSTQTQRVDSHDTITDLDASLEPRAGTPSDQSVADAPAPSGSPSPPANWKGKRKVSFSPASTSASRPSLATGLSIAPTSTTVQRPTTPPAQIQAEVLATTTTTPTSMTRSAGRRMQRVAELELGNQGQGQNQEQGQGQGGARGIKREHEDEDGVEDKQLATAMTEQGSPVRKRVKRG